MAIVAHQALALVVLMEITALVQEVIDTIKEEEQVLDLATGEIPEGSLNTSMMTIWTASMD